MNAIIITHAHAIKQVRDGLRRHVVMETVTQVARVIAVL